MFTKFCYKCCKLKIWIEIYNIFYVNYYIKVTAHGRTFVGLYAQKKILKGSLITIPFSFTGKKFTSTAKCFCDKENCSVSKWYQHRSTQVVRRLKIAESLLSDNIVVELPRKSRLRAEEKKLRSIIGETPVKRGRKSKDSILGK